MIFSDSSRFFTPKNGPDPIILNFLDFPSGIPNKVPDPLYGTTKAQPGPRLGPSWAQAGPKGDKAGICKVSGLSKFDEKTYQ